MANDPCSTITVLRAARGEFVRKTVSHTLSGIRTVQSYPRVRLWTRELVPLPPDPVELLDLIARLAATPTTCLVTGEPTGPVPLGTPARRLKFADGDDPATLAEGSAPWLPVDVDGFELTHRLDPLDPEASVAEVVARLGEPFASASFCWQLTASACPGSDRLSVRLFFLTDRPITNADRRAWADGLNGQLGVRVIDPAIYQACQPIYVAAPQFVGGKDPFPRRTGVAHGELEVVPWDDSVPIHETPANGDYRPLPGDGRSDRGIEFLLRSIGDHPDGAGFHEPIRQAIFQMVRARWLPDRIVAAIQATVRAADRSRHDSRYVEAQASERAIKASVRGAARRLKAEQQPARVTQTHADIAAVPLAEAVEQIRGHIRRWVAGEGPQKLVIKSTVGTGKTRIAADEILAGLPEGKSVVWAMPTHKLGAEVLSRFGECAVKIEGRLQGDTPLCQRPQLIQAINQAGLSRSTSRIACENGGVRCPFYGECGYQRQFRSGEPIRLVPHEYLALPTSRAWSDLPGELHGLIVDESPLSTLTGSKSYKLDEIPPGVLSEILAAWQSGAELPVGARDRLAAECTQHCATELPVHGPSGRDEAELLHELKHVARTKGPRFGALYRAALSRLDVATNAIWFGKSGAETTVHCAWRHELPKVPRVLVLDATAEPEIYRALLGEDAEVIEVRAHQNLEIIQCVDTPLGKRRLESEDGTLAQVVALSRLTGSALITNKAALESAQERGWLDGVPTAHFGALRGLNALEGCDSLVIAGRPEPDALAVEAIARALWPTASLSLPGKYEWRQDGSAAVGAHDDPRCDSVLRAIRESEVAQAIGRLRAVRSVTTKRVYVIGHTPTGLPVTRTTLDELLPDPKLAMLLLEGRGVAPLVPSVMVRMLPDVWPTTKAAERWLAKLKPPNPLYKTLSKEMGGFKSYRFRLEGQRKPSRVLSALPPEETRSQIERITGRPVVTLDLGPIPVEPPLPDEQTMTQIPEPPVPAEPEPPPGPPEVTVRVHTAAFVRSTPAQCGARVRRYRWSDVEKMARMAYGVFSGWS